MDRYQRYLDDSATDIISARRVVLLATATSVALFSVLSFYGITMLAPMASSGYMPHVSLVIRGASFIFAAGCALAVVGSAKIVRGLTNDLHEVRADARTRASTSRSLG